MFARSVLRMARQRRKYWLSPSRLGHIAWSLACNLHRQIEIIRILSLPLFRTLMFVDPAFPFKYLSTRYLFRGLSANKRAACFLHHYRFLKARLPGSFLRQRDQREMTVFETREGGSTFAVGLGFPTPNTHFEGELRLQLLVDGVQAYGLQFSIVPGWAVGSKERDAVIILRLQGTKGCFQQVRSATKTLHEVAPPALLVAALQGIANAWGIRELAGICSRSQTFYQEHIATQFQQTYDDFFLELGMARTAADFFSSPLPLVAKPLDQVRNGHKHRTLKKRAFKLQIADAVSRRITESSLEVADPRAVPPWMAGWEARSQERSVAS
jgi:uncharacterized protein